MIDTELQQIKNEIDTTSRHTVFNEISLFPEDGISPQEGMAGSKINHYTLRMNLLDGSYTVENLDQPAQEMMSMSAQASGRAAVNPVSGGGALADLIVKDLIPSAAKQIFDAFPSAKNNIGNETMDIKISVLRIDGSNKTLARAGFSWGNTGRGYNLQIEVDVADFTAADAEGTGKDRKSTRLNSSHGL